MRSRDRARGCGERVSLSYASGAARLRQLRATGQRSPDWWIVRLLTKKRFWLGATVMCGFPVKPAGCCGVARRRSDAVDPESPLSRQNCKVTVVGGPRAGVSLSASKLAAYSRLLGRFYGERGCQRAGQSPKNFPTHKIFLPPIPGLGAEEGRKILWGGRNHGLAAYSAKKWAVKDGDFCARHFLPGRFSEPQTGGTTHAKNRGFPNVSPVGETY